MRVLIADDEASIRHVLTLVLSESGYEVRAVSDGEEALKELAARSYDVVISDVRMPKVDGMALLRQALAAVHRLLRLDVQGELARRGTACRRGAGSPARTRRGGARAHTALYGLHPIFPPAEPDRWRLERLAVRQLRHGAG